MNILIPDSWLREFLDTDANAKDIQRCLSLCGPSIERLHKIGDDYIYDVEVTTNRVDCMSVYGLAREAAAILPEFGFKSHLKNLHLFKLQTGTIPDLIIRNDPTLCKRILALKIDGVKTIPSPQWLQNRLIAVGLRPINCLVDITNYVMWETGHPAHVFDFNRLTTKKMIIRLAKADENIITLDDKLHTLVGGEVIIDDSTGTIIDLPSIMGTANSVVAENTTSVLLFVDDVISSKVRFASMTHAIRTQAATLLEKDIDPSVSSETMSRMVQLVSEIFPEAIIGNLYDDFKQPTTVKEITLTFNRINELIGVEIPQTQIKEILTRLDFKVKSTKTDLTVTPPLWRGSDIQIAEDIVEEVTRIYGYHNIPPVLMAGHLPSPNNDKTFYWENRVKTALKYFGFTEVYTYSLVESDNGLKLKNPLTSDWVYLRTSLFPSHQKMITNNIGKVDVLNFFEIANVYLPENNKLPHEESRLIISSTLTDYYRFKGIITTLLMDLGINNFTPEIVSQNNILYWEIPMAFLQKQASDIKTYTPISKYAPIFEDLNINLIGKYADMEKKIYSISNLIKHIDLIDRYGSKTTLRLTYHSDKKQLSNDDILPIREKLASLSPA